MAKENWEKLPKWLRFNAFYRAKLRQDSGDWENLPHDPVHPHDANLVSSRTTDGHHKLMLDLDLEHWYSESSTEGHGHLVINTELEAYQIEEIIDVLVKHGIIQLGIQKQWEDRGCLTLRMPGMTKSNAEDNMSVEELRAIGKKVRAVPFKKIKSRFDLFKF